MAPGVNHADHFDAVAFQDEEHFVGEPAGEDAPHVLVKHAMMKWVLVDGPKRGVDLGEELVTEAGLASLLPVESLSHVGFGFRPDDDA